MQSSILFHTGVRPALRDLNPFIDAFINDLTQQGRLRQLRRLEPVGPARLLVNDKNILNFSGNDYLGLSQHKSLKKKVVQWTEAFGVGSGASRLVTGNLDIFDRVERKIASLKGTEDALIFASGFQANVSVLPALLTGGLFKGEPLVFCDRLNHASMHQGLMAAGIRQIRFRHNDLDHLESLLGERQDQAGPKFIITETVFSMDGDRADVARLAQIAEAFDAFLYLDEAHATGVLGRNGGGLSLEAEPKADMVMGTFSKALGSFGAYIACSAKLKSYLVNRASGLIYATALPPAVLGAMDAALDLLPSLDDQRMHVLALAEKARMRFHTAGLDTGQSSTQIVPVMIGDEKRALDLASLLEADGFLAIAIRPPTVPKGESRIRLAFSSDHSEAEVDALSDCLIQHFRALS